MKTKSTICIVLLSWLLLALLSNCKKEAVKVVPTITIEAVTNITPTTATCGGTITSDGGSAITAKGICWSSINTTPTISDSKISDGSASDTFTNLITGLTAETTYYLRSYATNSIGTAYSNAVSFNTNIYSNAIIFNPNLTYGTMTDIDGNIYKTITIGTQVWMAENLKTTKYRNGDPISNVIEPSTWSQLSSGAYCWYDNDATTNKAIYGGLYNWYAAMDSRNIAPEGWHLPTDAEWTTLTTFLGVDGGKFKEIGTIHWSIPNSGATNASGFTALAGGKLNFAAFEGIGRYGMWWLNTSGVNNFAIIRTFLFNNPYVSQSSYSRADGISIRCIKD